jgi:Domain of unknown function (DUF6468)
MPRMEMLLDLGLVVLLAATLFHAVRLERALGVLKRDRAALEALVSTFNASTRAAESGIERLRAATDGAGRRIQRQIDLASTLKDDLTFLVQRGEGLADRLDDLVRSARPAAAAPVESRGYRFGETRPPAPPVHEPGDDSRGRSQAERDLLKALRMAR